MRTYKIQRKAPLITNGSAFWGVTSLFGFGGLDKVWTTKFC